MYKRVFLFLFGFLMLAGVLYFVGFNETLNAVLSVRLEYFLLLLVLQLVTMVLSALKWRLILRHIKVSFKSVLASTFVGYLVNNITPIGMVGGEPVKAYLLSKREGVPLEKAFSSVIVDLFIEILPIFFLSAVAISVILYKGIDVGVAAVIFFASVVLSVLFVLCLTFVMNKTLSYKIVSGFVDAVTRLPFLRHKAGRIKKDVDLIYERFNDAMKKQLLDNYILYFGTLISLLVWTLRILRVYFIFLAFGVNIPVDVLVIVQTAVIVVTFIPISPGAIGVWEATSIGLFVLVSGGSVTAVEATSVAIIDRIIFYVFPTLVGAVAALYMGVDIFKLVSREVSDKVDIENVSKVIGGS